MFRAIVYCSLFVSSAIAFVVHRLARNAETRMEAGADAAGFHRLQKRYFSVYFLAAFSDWLQGPYVYNLYSYYGYTSSQIAVLYVVGFVSSVSFGTFVASLADRLGRKKLCIVYAVLYSFCCATKASPEFEVLLLGRVFGGIATSILFSTFEAWYVNEHVRRNYPQQWINLTMSKSTFCNAVLAIVAGLVANFVAETLALGPVSPFMLAIPCLVASGVLTKILWEENVLKADERPNGNNGNACFEALAIIFLSKSRNMLQLGAVQSVFESVMYTFVFLWTPVLAPISPPLGIVFSCFMVCIMIGSSLYSYLLSRNFPAERLLALAVALAFASLSVCTVATSRETPAFAVCCFGAFLVYEVAVGMYFPAMGYLRSRVVPEEYRASITNWFRVPMNLMVCSSLLLLRHDKADDHGSSSHLAFLLCSCLLTFAITISLNFTPSYVTHVDKLIEEEVC